ncbi:MAG: peptidase U32 family protein [Elusimicrobiota bacterium]
MIKKPELLAPAGNYDKLKIAVNYGADAVYMSGKKFGLRAAAQNFTLKEIEKAAEYVHEKNKKVYVAINVFARNKDFKPLPDYLEFLSKAGVDAVIASDPGVILTIKETTPEMPVILSTQANTTNYKSAWFWRRQGVKRIILARELSLKEIKSISDKIPKEMEKEVFIHGAMCISYSGRCLLSSYLTSRNSNLGDCTHPCRWQYNLMEEQRPGEYFPVIENEKGTTILSSKDLCLIKYIPQLIEAGVDSFKIEGRMKSEYYVGVTVSVYREAIDRYCNKPSNYKFDPKLEEELKKLNNRGYTEGFLISYPGQESQNYSGTSYKRTYDYCGKVISFDENSGKAAVMQKNKIEIGDYIEIIGPNGKCFSQKITEMWDEEDNPIKSAPHARQIFKLKTKHNVEPLDLIRKKI